MKKTAFRSIGIAALVGICIAAVPHNPFSQTNSIKVASANEMTLRGMIDEIRNIFTIDAGGRAGDYHGPAGIKDYTKFRDWDNYDERTLQVVCQQIRRYFNIRLSKQLAEKEKAEICVLDSTPQKMADFYYPIYKAEHRKVVSLQDVIVATQKAVLNANNAPITKYHEVPTKTTFKTWRYDAVKVQRACLNISQYFGVNVWENKADMERVCDPNATVMSIATHVHDFLDR